MSINQIKSSHEQAGVSPEDVQIIQKRAFRVAQSVYNLAVTAYNNYQEAVPSPAATPQTPAVVMPPSREVQEYTAKPDSTQLSLAQQAVINALEKEF